MAVVYMKKLEEEPETYDSKFTSLTKGVNTEVNNWILNQVTDTENILEIGCGTGRLAAELALKGNNVIAIDKNYQMINHAMKNYPREKELSLVYQIGTIADFKVEKESIDTITSTFMLSELRPFEQQNFLRYAWNALKPNGRIIIAAEFIPSGVWRLFFKIKRWWYKKKLRKLKLGETTVQNWFFNYIEPIGFSISSQKEWKHGSIRVLELKKEKQSGVEEPGFYTPNLKQYKGFKSQLRIYRCLLTGQVDRVPIEPGIYKSGTPTDNSPIIVTSNYEYTFIKVMRDMEGIDAWVLCVDSRGINVWCAARGNDFGNSQLLEAVEATNLSELTETRKLILPQLSAGGVAIPELPSNKDNFPYKIKYGPVWSKSLPEYLEEQPARKPDSMKLAKFTILHRLRAGATHLTFLFRKIFFIPLIILLILFLSLTWFDRLIWVGEIIFWIITANLIISILLPLSNFTRRFILKGTFFGILNVLILGSITWILHGNLLYILGNLLLIFWISFFSTMSFSGYTMATSPREIQGEYPIYRIINMILLIAGLISSALVLIFL